jgi:hypothetical protein
MKAGQDRKTTAGREYGNPPPLELSNPSSRIILVILLILILNAVAGYDSLLTGVLRLFRLLRSVSVRVGSTLADLVRKNRDCLRKLTHRPWSVSKSAENESAEAKSVVTSSPLRGDELDCPNEPTRGGSVSSPAQTEDHPKTSY